MAHTHEGFSIKALKSDVYTRSEMIEPEEQKEAIFDGLGDLDQYEMLDEEILVGLYVPSNVAASGTDVNGKKFNIILPENQTAEVRFQGKIGCVVKMGPAAFKYHNNGQPYEGIIPEKGDWVVFKAADATGEIFLKDLKAQEYINCRRFHWSSIKMRVKDPRAVR